MSTLKFLTCPTKRLATTISASDLTIKLNSITGWDGVDLAPADFGSQAFIALRNSAGTAMELMEIDPATIADASITILKRGLKFDGTLATEVTANKLIWIKGDTLVEIGSNPPQLLQFIKDYVDASVGAFPASSTDNAIVRFDGTSGVSVQNSDLKAGDISGNTITVTDLS